MYAAVNENRVNLIDNKQSRDVIINDIIFEYRINYGNLTGEMMSRLTDILTFYSLYDLLFLTPADIEVLLWNAVFFDFKEAVCKKVSGAREFFEIGSHKSPQNGFP